MAGVGAPSSWARTTAEGFSLCMVTDQPERSIDLVNQVLHRVRLPAATIRFEEYRIPGRHIGDIAFFRNHQLIDFRQAGGALSEGLASIAKTLGFPRSLDHPVFLKFYAGDHDLQATQAHIFQGNILVDQVSLDTDRPAYVVEGSRGSLTLAVKDRKVQVVGASCKHKTCMNMGRISLPGESLVCIPSRLSVTLDGTRRRGIDSVTQ